MPYPAHITSVMHTGKHRKGWKHSGKPLHDDEGSRSLMRRAYSQSCKPDTL